jgi:hypothetical protein
MEWSGAITLGIEGAVSVCWVSSAAPVLDNQTCLRTVRYHSRVRNRNIPASLNNTLTSSTLKFPTFEIRRVASTSSPSYRAEGSPSNSTDKVGLDASTVTPRLVSFAYVGLTLCACVECNRLPRFSRLSRHGKNRLKRKVTAGRCSVVGRSALIDKRIDRVS